MQEEVSVFGSFGLMALIAGVLVSHSSEEIEEATGWPYY